MTKSIRSFSIAVLAFFLFAGNVLAFADVDSNHPANGAVRALVKANKIGGGDLFHPDRKATRCEFLKMLTSPIPEGTNLEIIKMPYKDVPESSWCGESVKYALQTGVLSGTGTAFRPQDPIILVDAVRLVYRHYANFPLIDRLVSVRHYSDINVNDTTLPLYQIEQAVIDRVVKPESETRLGATKEMTRSDAAIMIHRAWAGYEYTRPDVNRILFGNADIRTKLAFLAAFNNISSDYIGRKDVNYDNLLRAVIKTAVETLGDKYTQYLSVEEFARFVDEEYGLYVGMGVKLDASDGKLRIGKVYEGSAAERAGILTGDGLMSVNGIDVQKATVEEFLGLFTRKVGDKVVLEIMRPGESAKRTFEVVMTKFIVPDVSYRDLGSGIAYFQIESFGDNTYAQFKDLYGKAAADAKGLVIDLRGNGGGQLSTASDMVSAFMPKATQVARLIDGDGQVAIVKTSKVPFVPKETPVVLIVDGSTASAAEMFATSLRDGRSVRIIGTKTFGKGTVQRVFPYPDGSALKVTTSVWTPAKSATIDKVGIVPDQEMGDTPATPQDDPLQAALSYLLG